MDKQTLSKILSSEYQPAFWRDILERVFGVKKLNQRPQPIVNLPSNNLTEAAFELGYFNTTDDRIIGLYQIDLKPNVRIERNKVGIRELLRNIYKHDVDGALVVFVQADKWRLSFISEIRVLNNDGRIEKRATEPKRYTYLLGRGGKIKTPTNRLSLLANKRIALEDIRNAFSVEALNNDFYKNVAEYFYELVGATTTKGKKTEVREKTMRLPSVSDKDRKTYQEFAVRLIGRTVFCWFLKMKKSENEKPLLPEKLLSSTAVENYKNYYHEILEPLFFQTLNTPMNERLAGLPEGCEIVPFLNGGLFEPQVEDFYDFNHRSGITNHINTLKIPDEWFVKFFKKLEEYNFTIDENSPTEVEISVDPEMLGRIFENLLAEIDPDSGETARKSTGSFYTPREIVNYMVDESLMIYLKSKLQTETIGFQALASPQTTFGGNDWRAGQLELEYQLKENRWQGKNEELEIQLRKLFAYSDSENPFNEIETEILIRAIHDCKILDPACGSGAFLIGILQRLVHLLEKLDRGNKKWKEWLKQRAIEETKRAFDEGDVEQRNTRLKQISEAFDKESKDYGRKLFLIENCIYGVDVQPIAADISKLRCFLTLVVDDTIDDDAKNRGVNPLPNLEFKFVTADALLKLPYSEQRSFFDSDTELKELEAIRHEYINSYGRTKEKAKEKFRRIQSSISDEQDQLEYANRNKRAVALSDWNPFGHVKVDWFDSEWMFGVKAFDIVIGNPPYIQMSKDGGHLAKKYVNENYETFERTGDIYCLFYEQGNNLLRKGGTLCYITSNKWMRAGYGESIRKFFSKKTNPILLIDFAGQKIFESATVDTNILLFSKDKNQQRTLACVVKEKVLNNLSLFIKQFATECPFKASESWVVLSPIEKRIKEKIEKIGIPLKEWDIRIYRGVLTGYNKAFIIDGKKKNELITADPKSAEIIRPILRGRDIKRYSYDFVDYWLLFIPWHFPLHKDPMIKGASLEAETAFEAQYPAVYNHLLQYKKELSNRNKSETGIRYEWYALQRWGANYWEDFSKQKIIWGEISDKTKFAVDINGDFTAEATTFILVGDSLLFLSAYLNSKFSEYFFSQIGTTTGVGTVRWKKFTIERLLVPVVSKTRREEYEKIVYQIIERHFQNQPFDELEQLLNSLVYNDIGLTADEINLIETFRQ